MKNIKVPLVGDTIDKEDVSDLISWLETNPKLTKGPETIKFEEKWSKWQQTRHSVFVNSGSSANLAMIYALMLSNRLKNDKIVVSSVSWVTTVAPILQLGLKPILCDVELSSLGVNIDHLRKIFRKEKPAALMIVHVLGIPNDMDAIQTLCDAHGVILLEDSCESIGSSYKSIKTGNFGLMSSFSTYFGHHFSTIEGGIINTNDEELYHLLLSIRSHGWDRDLPEWKQKSLRDKYNLSDFRALYSFYHPGFNLRSTDLQAHIGIKQIDKLDNIVEKRNENYLLYHSLITDKTYKPELVDDTYVSNFAYPIISENIHEIVHTMNEEGVEIRPLVCGSISEQPFWKDRFIKTSLPNAERIHKHGMYLPNNPFITKEQIEFICNIINNIV
jgi:CDP-6-deoxy-D-xylo-4-hexulose-3-dehydrase